MGIKTIYLKQVLSKTVEHTIMPSLSEYFIRWTIILQQKNIADAIHQYQLKIRVLINHKTLKLTK